MVEKPLSRTPLPFPNAASGAGSAAGQYKRELRPVGDDENAAEQKEEKGQGGPVELEDGLVEAETRDKQVHAHRGREVAVGARETPSITSRSGGLVGSPPPKRLKVGKLVSPRCLPPVHRERGYALWWVRNAAV